MLSTRGTTTNPRTARRLSNSAIFGIALISVVLAALLRLAVCGEPAGAAPGEKAAPASIEDRATLVIARNCLDCHNPSDRKGGLDLTRRERALSGGESGPGL